MLTATEISRARMGLVAYEIHAFDAIVNGARGMDAAVEHLDQLALSVQSWAAIYWALDRLYCA